MPATDHFTFDLMGPLIAQLDETFSRLTAIPLTQANLDEVHPESGVYQLWHGEARVYVGKADQDLQGRLSTHHRKLAARTNIDIAEMRFLGLYLEATWIPVGAERGLIDLYAGGVGGNGLPWNKNGFGINDPGRNRDRTHFKPDHFDVLYPANLDLVVPSLAAGAYNVADLIQTTKGHLPYTFRYEDKRAQHRDYLASSALITKAAPTARDVFQALAAALPLGWQITALPGYVIMYKDHVNYPSARETWRSG